MVSVSLTRQILAQSAKSGIIELSLIAFAVFQ